MKVQRNNCSLRILSFFIRLESVLPFFISFPQGQLRRIGGRGAAGRGWPVYGTLNKCEYRKPLLRNLTGDLPLSPFRAGKENSFTLCPSEKTPFQWVELFGREI